MFVLMNGLSGCMPDSVLEYETEASAIDEAIVTFSDDLSEDECEEMVGDLWEDGIHYFTDTIAAGADYVSVSVTVDTDSPEV